MTPIKLHRCSYTFLHHDIDACWKVERALRDQGVDYEIVKHGFGRGKAMRAKIEEQSGQKLLPFIEYADSTTYRAESADMATRIRDGRLGQTA